MVDQRVAALAVVALLIGALFILIHPVGGSGTDATDCPTNPTNYMTGEDAISNAKCNPVDFNLNKGLVGYWPLDEQSGTVAHDVSGNGNTGAWTSESGILPIWFSQPNCEYNGCLGMSHLGLFGSGINSRPVSIPITPSINLTKSFTATVWINEAPNVATLQGGGFGSFDFNTGNKRSWAIDFNNQTTVAGHIAADGTGSTETILSYKFPSSWEGRFQMFSLAFDSLAKTVSLYDNGSLLISKNTAYDHIFGAHSPITIGTYGGGTVPQQQGRNATYDDARLYNYTLSAGQVSYLYAHPPVQYPFFNVLNSQFDRNGLIGYWPFDEGTGTNAYDITPNQDMAKLMSSASWVTGSDCKFGDCINFPAMTNSYASVSTHFGNLSSFTVSVWLYPTDNNWYKNIISGKSPGYWRFEMTNNGSPSNHGLQYYDGSCAISTGDVLPGKLNSWSQAVLTFTSGNITIYSNGAFVANGTCAKSVDFGSLQFNRDFGGCDCSGQIMDDMRIYDRALSSIEVSALYAEGNGALPNPVYPEQNYQPTVTGITAGASVWTYTNNDGYTEQMILQTVNGITAETCYGIATTGVGLGETCILAPNGVMTVTWAVTAPVYTKVPLT